MEQSTEGLNHTTCLSGVITPKREIVWIAEHKDGSLFAVEACYNDKDELCLRTAPTYYTAQHFPDHYSCLLFLAQFDKETRDQFHCVEHEFVF